MSNSTALESEPDASAAAGGWRKLSGHALVYVGSSALAALVPFLILPFMTRWLGPAEFGVVAGFLVLVNFAVLFAGFNAHALISVVYFRDGGAAMPPQVGACFGVAALTSGPILVVLYVLGGPISEHMGVPAAWLWTVWFAACGQFATMIGLAVWQSLRMPFRFAAAQLSFSVLAAVSSVILVGAVGMGWTGRALGQAIGGGVMIVATVAVLTAARKVNWNVRQWPLRSTFQFGLGLLPHSVGVVVMTTIDRLALSGTVGVQSTGNYFAALQIASIITALASAFNSAWSPWLYERLARGDDRSKRQVVRATYVVYALLLAGAGAAAVFAPLIVWIVAGPAFDESAIMLRYLAPAAAFNGMYFMVCGYAFYTERTGTLSAITIGTAGVQAVLTLLLAHAEGARGVALATLLSAMIYWGVTSIVAQRLVPMPWLTHRKPLGATGS